MPLSNLHPSVIARRIAAEALLKSDASLTNISYTDLAHLVHELQVHQIELEMQHQELNESHAALEVSAAAALLASETRASLILRSSADGLFGTDRTGRITFINPAACELLGYQPEEVIGRLAHTLLHHSKPDGSPYPLAECPIHGSRFGNQEVRVDNEVFWHADGHAIAVMYSSHQIMGDDGKIMGLVTSLVDMSDRRAAIRARELSLLAAENLSRLRSEFIANLSAEIRAPLNAIMGFAGIGARTFANADKAAYAFNQILEAGQTLTSVVEGLLDFSRIEAGLLVVGQTTVNLSNLISQVHSLLAPRAQAKHLQLTVTLAPDLPKRFLGDPLRLGQVLLNLMTNAVKFTTAGSITLSVSLRDDLLEFKVADTGIGMAAERLEQLFHPFMQIGAYPRPPGGTGIGLALCKRLLDLMHGDICAESKPGIGSTFTFSVPYQPAPVEPVSAVQNATIGQRSTKDRPLAGLHLLVAEDSHVGQMIIDDLLTEAGATVSLVRSGREAVERVRTEGPSAYDAVLMDVDLPEMNGYEATRRLLVLAPYLPIIGHTSRDGGQRAQCMDAGMVAHVTKPVDHKVLTATILRHVAARVPAKKSTLSDERGEDYSNEIANPSLT